MSFKFFENVSVKEYELGEICNLISGISFKENQYKKSGFPVLKTKDIQDDLVQTFNLFYCNPEEHKKDKLIKYGDVVLAKDGSTAGKVGINLTDKEFFFDSHILKLETDEQVISRKYLYHFLLNCPEEIRKHVNTGVIPGIRKTSLATLKILVPPLEVQEYIVEKLDKFREIEREIEREISLRQKQYEHYREYLIGGE